MKQLSVAAIKDGTVIDHIPSNATFKVVSILNLQNYHDMITVATNLQSKSMGKKGLIKVAGKNINKNEAEAISIVAPEATLNIIENYKVIKKLNLEIPEKLDNVIKCSNPECITNHYETSTLFHIIGKNPLLVRCNYCERIMQSDEIEIKS